MRKIILVGLFFLFSFLVFFKHDAYAQTCASLGGNCLPICPPTFNNLGKYDCTLSSFGIPFDKCCKGGGATPTPGPVGSSACASLPCDLSGHTSCAVVDPASERGKCEACVTKNQIYTALGCVYTKPEDFVGQLLGWVMGIGGGLAFLLIVYGGFEIVTSTGDPEKLNAGKEIIVSALTGLLMIVFSVVLLHIIGVDILQIPGLSK